MSQIQPVAAREVKAAISRAAQRTKTDFNYLLAQARIESGLNPSAKSKHSSAAGLYQFINRTWQSTLDRHGAAHGIDLNQNGTRVMALRFDPETAATMAGELANDNRAALQPLIGRDPGSTDLYLAHFLGAAGAASLINAVESNSAQSAAAMLPEAAQSNRPIFYRHDGGARSVSELYSLIDTRMQQALALENSSMPSAYPRAAATEPSVALLRTSDTSAAPPIAREYEAARTNRPSQSMAEVLRITFGNTASSQDGTPEPVRTAYSRFKAFDL